MWLSAHCSHRPSLMGHRPWPATLTNQRRGPLWTHQPEARATMDGGHGQRPSPTRPSPEPKGSGDPLPDLAKVVGPCLGLGKHRWSLLRSGRGPPDLCEGWQRSPKLGRGPTTLAKSRRGLLEPLDFGEVH